MLGTASSQLSTYPASLVITSSSACLAGSLALLALVWTKGDLEEEYSEAGVLSHSAASLLVRWATCSAAASIAGLFGVVTGRLVLLRLFAVIAAFDLLCTILLLLVLVLLTYVPTLSEPFSTFLCGALTGGSPDEGLNLWGGLEVCEENWKVVMGVVSAGAAVAIGLRAWATAITWQHYGAVARMKGAARLEQDEWYDISAMDQEAKENLRRMKEVAASHTRAGKRASTLPILLGLNNRERPMPRHHGRYKSHSLSGGAPSANNHRPQLVLVPIFVDSHQSGPRSASSSSSFASSEPPSYSSHSSYARTPSTSRSSSCSSSSSRPHVSTYAPFTTSEPETLSRECSPKQRGRSRSDNDSSMVVSSWRQDVVGENSLGLSLEEVRCQ